ncbi:wee1-like protein kinase 2-C isoform X2 [Oscarella lobularis]|uniref:wee1-like protein kinase 2-C isoform X2 n=1 Tax=Oscarella lobularis TaxID=121494 RepID=UPI003313CDDB
MNLVHLDLKPGNVFVCCSNSEEEKPSCGDSCCPEISYKHVLYKIGDMGYVTSVYLPEVEEGDIWPMKFYKSAMEKIYPKTP